MLHKVPQLSSRAPKKNKVNNFSSIGNFLFRALLAMFFCAEFFHTQRRTIASCRLMILEYFEVAGRDKRNQFV